MRGENNFKKHFVNSTKKQSGKGRSTVLIKKRNSVLLTRYYYYGTFTDLRFETILKHLSDEFFISESRIQDIVVQDTTIISSLQKKQAKLKDFRQDIPHFVWN